MIRLIAFAAFAFAVTTPAQAMTVAPFHEPDGMITQVAWMRTGQDTSYGVCVRTTVRQHRRCVRWHGGACAGWRYY